MCGIGGWAGTGHGVTHARIQALRGALQHRGPDDEGLWFDSGLVSSDDLSPSRVGLVHKRLAIIDLSHAAAQPMADVTGRFRIVFNGEIYNYRELRAELAAAGCQFRTQSDTEVLLNGFAQWGPGILPRLVGMYAFVVHDAARHTLFLARDPFGIKPLFFARNSRAFWFASEAPALLKFAALKPRLNPQRAFDYLSLGQLDHGDESFFSGISSLPAGHFCEVNVDTGQLGPMRCQPPLQITGDYAYSFDQAVRHTRELFMESVALHMRSDVPVGACLSGGIDSSAIVCAIRYLYPQAEIHTFSYIAAGTAWSEERWIDTINAATNSHPHKVTVNPQELSSDLDELIRLQGEPFGSTSIYAQYRVFRLAREAGVKVLLDGQGADELLGGYPVFQGLRFAEMLRRGEWLRAVRFLRHSRTWPGRTPAYVLAAGCRSLLPKSMQSLALRLVGRPLVPPWIERRWFAEHGIPSPSPQYALRELPDLKAALLDSLAVTSIPGLLRYEDRNSMAYSIESRVPFLTVALAEHFYRLPSQYLIDDSGRSKAVLREALRGIVPDVILDRRDKIGFATAELDWLRTLTPWVEATLQGAEQVPYLRKDRLLQEWRLVQAGRVRFDFRVWRWLNLLRWTDLFGVMPA